MIDAGGSLILGHHPHVIQGIERYQQGVIAYSLGNFVFDMWQREVRQTMILKCELTPGRKIDYEIIPVEINLQWQPEIVEGKAARESLEAIRRLSNKVSVDTSDTVYRAELRRREEAYRREVLRWYLTHLHRYKPRRLAANLGRVVRRRLFRST
jgi:poly-gamma-glutamate synthesis protein (capsule biosynthesis protein)